MTKFIGPVRPELLHRAIDSRDPITAELNPTERAILGAVEMVQAAIELGAWLPDVIAIVESAWRSEMSAIENEKYQKTKPAPGEDKSS